MQDLSSKVIIQLGKTRFAGSSEATISLSNDRIIIKNSSQAFLDIPLAQIKKTNFQYTLLYIYTVDDGIKIVDFKTSNKSDDEVASEMEQWVSRLRVGSVNVKDSRRLFIIIASVLVAFATVRALTRLF